MIVLFSLVSGSMTNKSDQDKRKDESFKNLV